jgi:thioredoxin 1
VGIARRTALDRSRAARLPELRALKIEDGPGRPLGRSFRVKLWPTLIFMKDGVERERLVRPASEAEITAALIRLTA